MALSMAILTQVRIGSLRYQLVVVRNSTFADDSLRVDHEPQQQRGGARTRTGRDAKRNVQ